jgi:hypothetical protein
MMTKPTSEQVTFLAAGSGATQRTALDKFRDMVSVKDFGAVGDGVTDDTAAFQAAINAASHVIVPPTSSSYVVGNLTISSDRRIDVRGNISHSTSNALFTVSGTVGTTYPVSGSSAAGSRTITLSSVSGLAAGDRIILNELLGAPDEYFAAAYSVLSVVGTTVTVDRGLDFAVTTAATATKFVPVSCSICGDGVSEVVLSNQTPRLVLAQYVDMLEVSGLTARCTGTAPVSTTSSLGVVRIEDGINCDVSRVSITGLTGSDTYRGIDVRRCSFASARSCSLSGFVGTCIGIQFLHSTHSSASGCTLVDIPGGSSGAMLFYYSIGCLAEGNSICGTQYYDSIFHGSGIQFSRCGSGVISGNILTDIRGTACIYLSANCFDIDVVGNTCIGNYTDTNEHLASIMFRLGTNLNMVGNVVSYYGPEPRIWVRGVDGFSVIGNRIETDSTWTSGLFLFNKTGSEPVSAIYYPKNGIVSGNSCLAKTTTSLNASGVQVGELASNIVISGNNFDLEWTDTGSSDKRAIFLTGTDIQFLNNSVKATYASGGSEKVVVRIGLSSFTGVFSGNDIRSTNYDTLFIGSAAGMRGSDNVLLETDIYGVRAGSFVATSSVAGKTALRYGNTASRPTLTSNDAGFMYYDTTTSSIVTWTGTAWA